MAKNDFSAETPTNYAQKSICCFVVDTSGSMAGQAIDELNRGLQEFHQDISNSSATADRLEIAVVKFSDVVETVVEPGLASTFSMPMLITAGTTRLVDGVREGIGLVEARKDWYRNTGQQYLRPWLVLITDGAPDDGQDVNGLAEQIRSGVDGKKFIFYALGVQGANMGILNQISHHTMLPAMLQGLKFSEFFKWLSASMSIVASSKDGDQVNLPTPQDWMQGFKI